MYLMVHAVVLNGDVSYEVLSCYSTRMPTHKLTVNIHTHTIEPRTPQSCSQF